ncbi:MAG: hypothetical protein QXR23_08890 [Ignisphaera sp.]
MCEIEELVYLLHSIEHLEDKAIKLSFPDIKKEVIDLFIRELAEQIIASSTFSNKIYYDIISIPFKRDLEDEDRDKLRELLLLSKKSTKIFIVELHSYTLYYFIFY